MNKIKMVLFCIAGASSSFTIQRIRKAFAKRDLEIEINSQSLHGNTNIENVDIVLIAPHLKFMEKEVKQICQKAEKPYLIVSQEFYGFKEGYDVSEEILKKLEEFKTKE